MQLILDRAKRLYNSPIPIVAITGGIATGKSTVSNLLEKRALPLLCADTLIKEIYSYKESLDFIKLHFRNVICDGAINFRQLREVVFNQPEHLLTLENYLYPQLAKLFLKKIESYPSNTPYLFYDVPLLFEKKLEAFVDYKVLVYARKELQIERLILRDKITRELSIQILEQQFDIETKREKSDWIVENNSSQEILEKNVEELLSALLAWQKNHLESQS